MNLYDKFQKLYEIEKKYNLIYLKIDDVYIWQYLRVDIFHHLMGLETNSFSVSKKQSYFKMLKNAIFYNPFFLPKKDKLIFLNPRKRIYNEEYEDIILYDFYKNQDVNVIDTDAFYKTKYKRFDLLILLMGIKRKFIKVNISKEEKNFLNKIASIFENEFQVKIDFVLLFGKYIKTFKAFCGVYSLLFKFLKPKEIYFLVNYGNAPLIKAAKDLGIKTTEVQHGIFGFFHSGYYYKGYKKIEYFPDKLYLWGDYFKTLNYLPECEKEIVEISYMKKQYEKYKNIKEKNQILVISDGGDSRGSLERFLLNNDFEEKIIYKFHPQEYNDKKLYYKDKLLNKYKNQIEFVTDEYDLYQLLKESKIIFSIRTTVVYEALAMNKIVVIVKGYGWEDFLELKDYIVFIEEDEKFNEKRLNNIKRLKGNFFIKSFGDNNV